MNIEVKKQVENEKLRLMVFRSDLKLGKSIDECLLDMYGIDKDQYTLMVPHKGKLF